MARYAYITSKSGRRSIRYHIFIFFYTYLILFPPEGGREIINQLCSIFMDVTPVWHGTHEGWVGFG